MPARQSVAPTATVVARSRLIVPTCADPDTIRFAIGLPGSPPCRQRRSRSTGVSLIEREDPVTPVLNGASARPLAVGLYLLRRRSIPAQHRPSVATRSTQSRAGRGKTSALRRRRTSPRLCAPRFARRDDLGSMPRCAAERRRERGISRADRGPRGQTAINGVRCARVVAFEVRSPASASPRRALERSSACATAHRERACGSRVDDLFGSRGTR